MQLIYGWKNMNGVWLGYRHQVETKDKLVLYMIGSLNNCVTRL